MAKRRMISQNINIDEELNCLSIESQLMFYKLLSVSDDCGVVPGNEYALTRLTNPPNKILKKFSGILAEIYQAKLLIKFEWNGKLFYCFKKDSFEREQAYIIKNRTRSEYLNISVEEFLANYDSFLAFPENSGNYREIEDNESYPIVSNKHKVISKELKAKSIKHKEGEHLFENSDYYDLQRFIDKISEDEKYKVFDLEYYHEAMKNWSEGEGKMKKNWITTAKNWMLRDHKDNKAKYSKLYINENGTNQNRGNIKGFNFERATAWINSH